jgi:hypothetical protein
MGLFRRYFTLDDAEAFLAEAKGLPAISSTNIRLRRCLRACILLSWIALEDGLDSAIEDWGNKRQTFDALPSQLKQRIIAILSAVSTYKMDDSDFNRLRKIRNLLTHPNTKEDDPKLTVEVTEQTFQFCLTTLRALSPYTIVCPCNIEDVLQRHAISERLTTLKRRSSHRP